MPELPEVETMVRGIRPHVQGRVVSAVRRCRCKRKPLTISPSFRTFAGKIKNATIATVRRVAKRVVLDFSNDRTLAIEPRMTGLMLLADPPSKEHLRLRWDFTGSGEFNSLWYWDRRGLGTVRLYEPGVFESDVVKGKLGPDALDMSVALWKQLCAAKKQAIKVALLDQKWVAGIGNLYASEILYAAGIPPALAANELQPDQIKKLARATRRILNDAIRYEGSTLSDATYRNALNKDGGYQNEHRVYGREGEQCPNCGVVEIVRMVQAQRSTFFCPNCQG